MTPTQTREEIKRDGPNRHPKKPQPYLLVRFRKKGYKGYQAGEVAGFDPVLAGRLVASASAMWQSAKEQEKAKTMKVDSLPVTDVTALDLEAMAKALVAEQLEKTEGVHQAQLAERDAEIAKLKAELETSTKKKK